MAMWQKIKRIRESIKILNGQKDKSLCKADKWGLSRTVTIEVHKPRWKDAAVGVA
jgi:hypothetical protein